MNGTYRDAVPQPGTTFVINTPRMNTTHAQQLMIYYHHHYHHCHCTCSHHYVIIVDLRTQPRSLLLSTIDSVCLTECLSVTNFKLLLFCFSMDLAIFWPSVLHDPLYKTFSSIFSARQHAERAICYRPSVRSSVRLFVTRVDQSKMVERIIEMLSPSDRPNILVFRHQRSLRKSDGFTPNGGAKYKGVAKTSNFRPLFGYISETVLDRGIVTMEDEYKGPMCSIDQCHFR